MSDWKPRSNGTILRAALAKRGITDTAGKTNRVMVEMLTAVDGESAPAQEPAGPLHAPPVMDPPPPVVTHTRASAPQVFEGTEPKRGSLEDSYTPRTGKTEAMRKEVAEVQAGGELQRWTITRGGIARRGIGTPPELGKGEKLELSACAKVGDRVCLSEHGSRCGRVSEVGDASAFIELDGKWMRDGELVDTIHVDLADCTVIP